MSPTILREKGYRFFFFSREDQRKHVHVSGPGGEAKFWLEPRIELERNHNLSRSSLTEIERIIEEHWGEFKEAWDLRARNRSD